MYQNIQTFKPRFYDQKYFEYPTQFLRLFIYLVLLNHLTRI